MREGFKKPDNNKKTKLSAIAGAAMLAGVAGNAEAANVTVLKTRVANPTQSVEEVHKKTLQEKKNTEDERLSLGDMSKVEGMIERNSAPLSLQIKFLESALRANGSYFKELKDRNLSKERLSHIFALVNTVSARLTNAFSNDRNDPELQKYFSEVHALRAATSSLVIERGNAKTMCNKFSVEDRGEVYTVTAYHCVQNSPLEKEYFRPPNTDIAIKYTPHTPVIAALPVAPRETSSEAMSGRVITSFSVASDGKEKVHFSIAFPLTANTRLVFREEDIKQFGATGLMESMMYFKPYAEGQLKPETGQINASGSSGGPIVASGIGVIGNSMATIEIRDTCKNLCYATSFFSDPSAFRNAIDAEKDRRAGDLLMQGK